MDWIINKISQHETFTLDEFILNSGIEFPLLDDLKNCVQDSEWHAEGNVHIHTNMVLQEALRLSQEEYCSQEERLILALAAITHDIFKPLTSKLKEIDGLSRVVAPRHAEGGAMYLKHRLHHIPETIRDSVIELVRHHHDPRRCIADNNVDHATIAYITKRVPGKLLYILCKADILGRQCIDRQQLLDTLEEFKLFLIEYQCYDTTSNYDAIIKSSLGVNELNYQFIRTRQDLYQGRMLDPVVGGVKYYHEPTAPVVIIMCGLSGSGKSTVARQLQDEYGFDIISPDAIRKGSSLTHRKAAYRESIEQLKIALRLKQSVIFDATNIRNDTRGKIIEMTEKYQGITCLVEMFKPLSECITNDAKRGMDTSVGASIIRDQSFKCQYPEYKDFHLWNIDELHKYLKS